MYDGQGLEFNPQTDDWNTYIEQLEYFYEANNDSDDSKKSNFTELLRNSDA